jgi:hypothetical protein
MTAGHVAVNALHALDRARRIGVAKNQRRSLHRHAIDEQSQRHVDDLVAARAQRRDQSFGFRRSVADENQGADVRRAPG